MADQFAINDVPNLDEEQVAAGYSSSDDDDDHEMRMSSRNVVEVINKLISNAESSEAMSLTDLVSELCDELNKFKELTSITVCSAFKGFITRLLMKKNVCLKFEDPGASLKQTKLDIAQRAREFVAACEQAPLAVAQYSRTFDFNNQIVLVHGFSVAVLEVLKTAAHEDQKAFEVVCTVGSPENTGLKMAEELSKLGIPVKLSSDSSVASIMDDMTMVLVGADGIMKENGGIINQIGTYQIAIIAENMNKPLYVAAESFKISLWPCPTAPTDFKQVLFKHTDFGVPIPPNVNLERATQDYTPPTHIREFWTDSGRFTPTDACINLKVQV